MDSRNVVVICLDTVRKDYFDLYASRIQDLATVSFEQCRTPSSWTVPSHASMMTGKLPHEHGCHTYNRSFRDINPEETFLADLPHTTCCISSNPYLTNMGYTELFDHGRGAFGKRYPEEASLHSYIWNTDTSWPYFRFWKNADSLGSLYKRAANALYQIIDDNATGWPIPTLLDDGASNLIPHYATKQFCEQDEPLFLFINYMEAHRPLSQVRGIDKDLHSASNRWSTERVGPWELMSTIDERDEYLRKRRELYGATIEYLDRKVGNLITRIRNISTRETTVIVTADHGENLGFPYENHHVGHKSSLTESLLHVPLYIVNPPEGYDEYESSYFSQLNMGELITGIAANETPDVFGGPIRAELIGLCEKDPPGNKEYWDRMIRCRYEDDTKYVWDSTGTAVAYGLNRQRPCYQREIDLAFQSDEFDSEFAVSMDEYEQTATENGNENEISERTKESLEYLGYH